jgi:hypothetical protein
MTTADIAILRLINQQIAQTNFTKPSEIVAWLGAMQAQDFAGAKWSIGLRLPNFTDADIEKTLADRNIVRTWPMRGTLHFVAVDDILWMLGLLTPRIVANSAGRHKQLGLDENTFNLSKDLFIKSLQGGKQIPRDGMYKLLEASKISTSGQRGIHILWRLAQEGLLCFGAPEGKQQTFALLHEWIPKSKSLLRDEALAELALRYFTSHGPATLHDFIWWSGLRASEAKTALEFVKPKLISEIVSGQTYWFLQSLNAKINKSPTAFLLPGFDEFMVSYKDRSAALDPKYKKLMNGGNGILSPVIVIDGQAVGTWRRTIKKDSIVLETKPFTTFSKIQSQEIAKAANLYGKFLGRSVV